MLQKTALTLLFSLLVSCVHGANTTDTISYVIELDASNYSAVIDSTETVLMIDFYSPECPACNKMTPLIESLAKEFKGRAVIAKVDTDIDDDIWPKYSVQSLPTFVFIKNGEVYSRFAGGQTLDVLREAIQHGLDQE